MFAAKCLHYYMLRKFINFNLSAVKRMLLIFVIYLVY